MTDELLALRNATRELTLPAGTTIAAVCGVTATIHTGARIALTGPSGSGKTTLIHLCAGLDLPTSGTVSWPGLVDGPAHPGIVGVAFQAPSLIPWLSVELNVALPVLAAGTERAPALASAREMLARFGLASLASRLPSELSGGQAQRAALARALVSRPALVLADEPTGQLDGDTAQSAIAVLHDTARHDCAILFATHDERIASAFDVRWTMADGAISSP